MTKDLALFLATIYVLVHSSTADSVRAYEGQSKQTIQALLASEGRTGKFISEREYKSFLAAHSYDVKSTPNRSDQERNLSSPKSKKASTAK